MSNFNIHQFIKERYGGVKNGIEVKSKLCEQQRLYDRMVGLRGAHGKSNMNRNEKILLEAAIGLEATEKARLGLTVPHEDSGRPWETPSSTEGAGSELARYQMGADRPDGMVGRCTSELDSQTARQEAATTSQTAREAEEATESQETET